jgi:hypothetical protein
MATQTLARPKQFETINAPIRFAVATHRRRARSATALPMPSPTSTRRTRLNNAKLQEVEDALLASVMEHHPQHDEALERVLGELDALCGTVAAGRALLLRSSRDINRVEDLLLEAVIRTYPNRTRALDRLFDHIAADDACVDPENDQSELTERANFDMQIDNDFDGLG